MLDDLIGPRAHHIGTWGRKNPGAKGVGRPVAADWTNVWRRMPRGDVGAALPAPCCEEGAS
eukprot:3628086-Pyramimonas_sp.AAC.1